MRYPMVKRLAVPAAAFSLITALPAVGSTATIAQILDNPSSFDGHHVDVKGVVEHLERNVSHQGNSYATFSLCSRQCIRVFAFGAPNAGNGQTITVHGIYERVNNISGYAFNNGIKTDTPGDSQGPCD